MGLMFSEKRERMAMDMAGGEEWAADEEIKRRRRRRSTMIERAGRFQSNAGLGDIYEQLCAGAPNISW